MNVLAELEDIQGSEEGFLVREKVQGVKGSSKDSSGGSRDPEGHFTITEKIPVVLEEFPGVLYLIQGCFEEIPGNHLDILFVLV